MLKETEMLDFHFNVSADGKTAFEVSCAPDVLANGIPESKSKNGEKIRTIYWKQWKKVRTKFKEIKKLGVEEEKAWICANMRNGNWYCGGFNPFVYVSIILPFMSN